MIWGPYDWVSASWHTPAVRTLDAPLGITKYALWVGIDGDLSFGLPDLWQAGTWAENMAFTIFDSPPISFTKYFAWSEFLPQQPGEQTITAIPVAPEDEIYCSVWIADAGGAPSLNGYFGQAFLMNLTTQRSTWIYTERSATIVNGGTAEWIMERPGLPAPQKGLWDLADYGSAVMSNAVARLADSPPRAGYVACQRGMNRPITMLDKAGRITSTVEAIDAYSMRFRYGNPIFGRVEAVNPIRIGP
jgi:hypothetical protein